MPEIVILNVPPCSLFQLALAIADVHDARGQIVDDVALGIVEVIVGGRRRIGRDKNDLCVLRNGSRPLHIERVLDEIALTAQQVGRTGADRKRLTIAGDALGRIPTVVGGQIEVVTEGRNIIVAIASGLPDFDIAGSGDGDRLTRPVNSGIPCACHVVDGGKVPGAHIFHQIRTRTADTDAELRPSRDGCLGASTCC